MIVKGERLEILAFHPWFIYNSCFWVCQEQAVFSACLDTYGVIIPEAVPHT